jgi:hypothetical protein
MELRINKTTDTQRIGELVGVFSGSANFVATFDLGGKNRLFSPNGDCNCACNCGNCDCGSDNNDCGVCSNW